MANIATSNDWPAGVYQYADGDVLDGGADSSEVLPLKQLANRSLFQRLANVTLWDSALATEYGYPNKACVMHNGLTYRAKVANNVEPGTDALKWERWGYSESELTGPSTGSMTESGWTRLPNGLMLQWGMITRTGAAAGIGNNVSWIATLPIAFPNAIFQAIACSGVGGIPHIDLVNDPVEHNISVTNLSLTAIGGRALRIYGSPAETDFLNVSWIAFGN